MYALAYNNRGYVYEARGDREELRLVPCHRTDRRQSQSRAPRWRDLYMKHPVLALREPLSRGIACPHDEMPKFELSDKDVDTIVAYVNSLSP